MNVVIAVLAIAILADIVTTERGLARGGCEANPIMRLAMTLPGRGWIIPKIALTAGPAYWLWIQGYPDTIWIIVACNFVIALWNWRVQR